MKTAAFFFSLWCFCLTIVTSQQVIISVRLLSSILCVRVAQLCMSHMRSIRRWRSQVNRAAEPSSLSWQGKHLSSNALALSWQEKYCSAHILLSPPKASELRCAVYLSAELLAVWQNPAARSCSVHTSAVTEHSDQVVMHTTWWRLTTVPTELRNWDCSRKLHVGGCWWKLASKRKKK